MIGEKKGSNSYNKDMSFNPMAAQLEADVPDIQNLSRKLYFAVNKRVGSEFVVKLRRNKFEIMDSLNLCDSSSSYIRIVRGSYSEGFELSTSDLDIMLVNKNVMVFPDNHYISPQDMGRFREILYAVHGHTPGFVLLKCVKFQTSGNSIGSFLVAKTGDLYLSCTLFRNLIGNMVGNLYLHGPCATGKLNDLECDFGPCLYSPFWPNQCYAFIERSLNLGWPTSSTLKQICQEGCLFVPVNAKEVQCSDSMDLQWRISFSLAEKRIISSMNHCQFLCYGLLKIFLNEVLKKVHDEVFSSYHMKVALFWEISENVHSWTKENLLQKFWNVFRKILKWTSAEYFPHFFVSERNMFSGKLFRGDSISILETLRPLYEEGYTVIFRCLSLAEELPFHGFSLDLYQCQFTEHRSINFTGIEEIEAVLLFRNVLSTDRESLDKMLLNTLTINPTSQEMASATKLRVNYLLQRILETNLNVPFSNRHFYTVQLRSKILLKRIRTCVIESEMILIIFYYNSGQYLKAIAAVKRAKEKLRQNDVMFILNLDQRFIADTFDAGLSPDEIITSSIVACATFNSDYTIQELRLECLAKQTHSIDTEVNVPPFVFLDFMSLLSYNKLGDIHTRNEILRDLYVLICFDNGTYIHYLFRAISYEILGICQQLCGLRCSAYSSYIIALGDEYNDFKNATIMRIQSLCA